MGVLVHEIVAYSRLVRRRWARSLAVSYCERCEEGFTMAASTAASLHERPKTSKSWEHVTLNKAKQTITCKHCKADFAWHGSTTSTRLLKKHIGVLEMDEDSPRYKDCFCLLHSAAPYFIEYFIDKTVILCLLCFKKKKVSLWAFIWTTCKQVC